LTDPSLHRPTAPRRLADPPSAPCGGSASARLPRAPAKQGRPSSVAVPLQAAIPAWSLQTLLTVKMYSSTQVRMTGDNRWADLLVGLGAQIGKN